jgi:hypothetical protein
MTKTPKIGDWFWHVHHKRLCELLTEPLENRIVYMKDNKPENEIETRLRWMTPVRGRVPVALVEAGPAYDKARAAYQEAGPAYDKPRAAYQKARAAYRKAWVVAGAVLERLHAKEHPGCPWDGKRLVFPQAK